MENAVWMMIFICRVFQKRKQAWYLLDQAEKNRHLPVWTVNTCWWFLWIESCWFLVHQLRRRLQMLLKWFTASHSNLRHSAYPGESKIKEMQAQVQRIRSLRVWEVLFFFPQAPWQWFHHRRSRWPCFFRKAWSDVSVRTGFSGWSGSAAEQTVSRGCLWVRHRL